MTALITRSGDEKASLTHPLVLAFRICSRDKTSLHSQMVLRGLQRALNEEQGLE